MKKQTSIWKICITLFLAALLIIPGQVTAQKKKKKKQEADRDHSWDYTVVRNAPGQISPYTISLFPLIFEVNGLPGSGLGAEGDFNYQINDDFEAFASINYNYLIVAQAPNNYTYLPATPGANLGFELAGTWFFSDEARNGPEQVLLYSESGGYRTTINHVAKIDLDHQQKFGLRLGFNLLNYTVGDIDGSSFVAYNTQNQSSAKFSPQASMLTNAHSGVFAVGLVSEKIHDYKLSFKNGVERNMSRKMAWHLDLLLNAFTNYDNVVSQDSVYNVNKYTPRSALGARVGFDSQNLLPFGANFGLDFGIMPGAPQQLFFFAFKIGMSFNKGMD